MADSSQNCQIYQKRLLATSIVQLLYVERSFVSIFVDMRVSLPPLPIWCVTVWLLATWLLMTLKGLFSTLVFTC